jgi:hypothetical protein
MPDTHRACRRILVTLQRAEDADAAVARIAELIEGGSCDVEIVGVVGPLPFVGYWAPLAGGSLAEMRETRLEQAALGVRAALDRLEGDVRVEHRVCSGWRERQTLRRLSDGDVDALVLAAEPSRWQDRRALLSAARVGGARVVACAS